MKRHAVSIWAPFAVVSLLTLLARKTLWSIGPYWYLLASLGVISVILAARVVAKTGWQRWTVAWLVIGLVVGQWWLIEAVAVQLLWRLRGYAP